MTVDFLERNDTTSTEAIPTTDRGMTIELDRTDRPRWLPRSTAEVGQSEAKPYDYLDALERLRRYLTLRWSQYTFVPALPQRPARVAGWALLQRLSNRTVLHGEIGQEDEHRLDDAPHPDVWRDLPASRWT